MKAFQLKISTLLATIVMLSGVILFGCSDRDNNKAIEDLIPNMNLNPEILDQTVWKGEVIDYYEGKESNRYQVNLFFRAGEVVFFLKGRNDEIESRGTRPYLVDKGMLSISWTWTSPQLSGDWLAFEVSKDKLILQKGYGNNNFNYIMTLTRTD